MFHVSVCTLAASHAYSCALPATPVRRGRVMCPSIWRACTPCPRGISSIVAQWYGGAVGGAVGRSKVGVPIAPRQSRAGPHLIHEGTQTQHPLAHDSLLCQAQLNPLCRGPVPNNHDLIGDSTCGHQPHVQGLEGCGCIGHVGARVAWVACTCECMCGGKLGGAMRYMQKQGVGVYARIVIVSSAAGY